MHVRIFQEISVMCIVLKGIQATASAIAFGYSLVWDLYQISLCMLISLGASILFFLLCDYFVERVDPKRNVVE